ELAHEKRCTPAQFALAWVLAQGDDIVPIPGTKRRKYLQENVGALDVILTSADLARIEEVAPKHAAAGERYPDWAMQMVNRGAAPLRSPASSAQFRRADLSSRCAAERSRTSASTATVGD